MKFDKKYPDAVPLKEPEEGLAKVESKRPCWHCEEKTDWADIDFGAFLCSEECRKAKWDEYHTALQESGPLNLE